jgi:hypothetical protein
MTKEIYVLATSYPYEGYTSPFAAYYDYDKAVERRNKEQSEYLSDSIMGPEVTLFAITIEDAD